MFAQRLALGETSQEPGKKALPTWVLAGSADAWVDRLSAVATLPPSRRSLVRGSHTSIVKPRDREADAYRSVRGWIETSLARKAAPAPAVASSGAPSVKPPAAAPSGPASVEPPPAAVPPRFTYRSMEYVYVAPGPFTMGSTDAVVAALNEADGSDAFSRELPAHVVDVPGFYVARYPARQADYAAFVAATGRATLFRDDAYSRPYNWDPERRTFPAGMADHPVVLVTWDDAVAYCRWLGGRLATEAEWEKAARGADRREWPWGGRWRPGLCNSAESQIGGTSAVGRFSPAGDSPSGAADMAGNVYEWCASLYLPYPYRADDGRDDPQAPGDRVMRGGACGLDQNKVRCAFRNHAAPDDFGFTIGFRVAFDRPPEGVVT